MYPGRRSAVVVSALLALGACSAAPSTDGWWRAAGAVDAETRLDSPVFHGAAQLLSGFDAPTERDRLEDGDRALFAVELRESGEEPSRFLIRVAVASAAVRHGGQEMVWTMSYRMNSTSGKSEVFREVCRLVQLHVSRHDLDGTQEAESDVYLGRAALETGFAETCATFVETGAGPEVTLSSEQAHDIGLSVMSLRALMTIVESDRQLSELLQRVARRPSLASIISNFGVEIGIEAELHNAQRIAVPEVAGAEAWRVPLVIRANGEPAVLVLAEVVTPRSPWNLSAGVVRLTARRPGDEEARLVMQAIAVRHCPSP